MNLKLGLGMLILVLLQACSSMEVTQSRYGNGLGISFGKSSKKEEAKTTEFRKRKRDEAMDRKHQVNPKPRSLSQVSIAPIEVAQKVKRSIKNSASQTEQYNTRSTEGNAQAVPLKAHEPQGQSIVIDEYKSNKNVQPVRVAESQGNTYNLGYIGLVLVIAGLVLLLVGIPQAFSVIVLGVVLIILAYFLG